MNTTALIPAASTRAQRFALVFLAAAALALAGCSGYRAPTLSVTGGGVAERTEQGVVVSFTVNASHDNGDVLPLREARYTLELNGATVFSGVRSAQCTLSRFGSQQFTIPAAVPAASLAGLSGGSVSYRLSGSLSYVTPGALAELLYDTGVSRPTVGFSQQGTLDLTASPEPVTKVGLFGSR